MSTLLIVPFVFKMASVKDLIEHLSIIKLKEKSKPYFILLILFVTQLLSPSFTAMVSLFCAGPRLYEPLFGKQTNIFYS